MTGDKAYVTDTVLAVIKMDGARVASHPKFNKWSPPPFDRET